MTTPSDSRAKDLLDVAAGVLDGTRDRSELDAHGISLGEPVTGEDAKSMLLGELEAAEELEAATVKLWAAMAEQGAEEGSRARLEARFSATEEKAATSLATSISEEWGDEGWEVTVGKAGAPAEGHRVVVFTRPVVLGPEVLQVLLGQMADTAKQFPCTFDGLHLAAPKKRPWWRLW